MKSALRHIVSCPSTNCLYLMECSEDDENVIVHRVTPNGAVLKRWVILSATHVNSMTLSPTGVYLTITTDNMAEIYDVTSGAMISSVQLTLNEQVLNRKTFVTAGLVYNEGRTFMNIHEDLIHVTRTPKGPHKASMAVYNDQCFLIMSPGVSLCLQQKVELLRGDGN